MVGETKTFFEGGAEASKVHRPSAHSTTKKEPCCMPKRFSPKDRQVLGEGAKMMEFRDKHLCRDSDLAKMIFKVGGTAGYLDAHI